VLRRFALTSLVLAGVLVAATLVALPPAARDAMPADFTLGWPVVRGAYHVHSQHSDGTGTLDEIAAAAAAAGLQFVILTDHGNGLRAPEPPSYRSGVLCLDAVEISTDAGHVVALGLPRAPYPIAGHPRDVIDDVHRLGGFGFAAHPGSPKPALQWRDWDAPFDGLEWLNADSEWRDEFWGSLGRVLLTYPVRPTETLADLLDRPVDVLRQWDRVALTRRVSAIAGADAHARLGFRQATEPYEDRVLMRVPSYETSFKAFVNHVVIDGPLIGDAAVDAVTLLSAIREGRMFTSIDGLAKLGAFEAKATTGGAFARPGEYLEPAGPVAIDARIAAPDGTTLVVVKDGAPIYDSVGSAIRLDVGEQPGAYRIEAHLPRSMARTSVPWVLTNPIYVGLRRAHADAAAAKAIRPATTRSGFATGRWQAEAGEGSTSVLTQAALADGTPALEWRFALAGGPRAQQYAALHFPVDQRLAGHDRLQFRVQSDSPHRLWVQIRAPGDGGGERWGRSFYVDRALQSIEFLFSEMRQLGGEPVARPSLDRMDSVLFVIDTLNTLPGTSGVLRFPDLWLAR
jgi:hypothetical protein